MPKPEAQTRTQLIDSQLARSGWDVRDPTQVIEEFDIQVPGAENIAEPHTPDGRHQFSDYVLLGRDGRPLAIVDC